MFVCFVLKIHIVSYINYIHTIRLIYNMCNWCTYSSQRDTYSFKDILISINILVVNNIK
jgi:hypothetical protein